MVDNAVVHVSVLAADKRMRGNYYDKLINKIDDINQLMDMYDN